MNRRSMVEALLDRQRIYDQAVEKAHGVRIRQLDDSRIKAALTDEAGELNHELKSRWCWWKKTQEPEDRDKVLEELADVWHFALMVILRLTEPGSAGREAFINGVGTMSQYIPDTSPCEFLSCWTGHQLWLTATPTAFEGAGMMLSGLTQYCGFSLDDVYTAYIKKNEENFARIRRGY